MPLRPRYCLFITLILLAFCHETIAESGQRLSGVNRVVVIGDVHGVFDEMTGVLQAAGLIDSELHWSGGETHLVSLGDLLDRGPRSRAVMDLLMRLESQALEAGGRVHMVLGNHEVMNLTRDLSYVAADELAQYSDLDPLGEGDPMRGHRAAFSSEGRYGRWLLSLPLLLVINDTLYLHAGLSEDLLSLSLDQINQKGLDELRQFIEGFETLVSASLLDPGAEFVEIVAAARRSHLDPALDPAVREAAGNLVAAVSGLPFDPDGPLWYRGTALCHPYFELPVVDRALAHFAVDRMVVGHSPTADGNPHTRMDGKVVRVDTGMNRSVNGGNPTALELDADGIEFISPGGAPGTSVAEGNRWWPRPYGMNDAQMEQFLATAEVTRVEELATGITKPKRLTLEQDGRTLRAVLKLFDSDNNLEKQRWSRTADKSDRFVYDYLAYRLDRMLGLEMVPPAVLREVDGQPGLVQYWVENAINEKERRAQNLAYDGVCSLREQYNLMNVFDALIHNDDRNLSNVLFQKSDWKIWLIDHTRAFRSDRRLPELYRDAEMTVSEPMAAALESLTTERLKAELGAYLHPRQIAGLEARIRILTRRK